MAKVNLSSLVLLRDVESCVDSFESDVPIVDKSICSTIRECFRSLYAGGCATTCEFQAKFILDYCWEQLNVGHWKDIHVSWRHLYTLASLAKVMANLMQKQESPCRDFYANTIKICDMGLLMGAPLFGNILAKLASSLLEECNFLHPHGVEVSKATSERKGIVVKELHKRKKKEFNLCREVVTESLPTVEHFFLEYFQTLAPVKICEAMIVWPCMSQRPWSLQYIRHVAGLRTVPVELGARYTDNNWSQTLVTINEFIDQYIQKKPEVVGYLAQHQLFEQIPELRNDICIPDYCFVGEKEDVDINSWFGPGGTISPLHYDPKHNFLAQILGKKYIRLYSPKYCDALYPHESELLFNTSQVDAENPDVQKFPKFLETPYYECVLKEGEMLYIPPKYWHYVKSLSTSFSVSFWFE